MKPKSLKTAARGKPWTPHDYQVRAAQFLVERAAAALFLDPGLGKTSTTLAAFSALKKRGLVGGMVILAPLRVAHGVWPQEIEKWSDFHGLKITVLHGPKKDELLAEDSDIFVVNYEGLSWLTANNAKLRPKGSKKSKSPLDVILERFGATVLVEDELSKLKNSASMRFKIMRKILPRFARRWGLTGTPASNGYMDLFGEMFCVDEGQSLGQYITHYRSTYFYQPPGQQFIYSLLPGAEEKIQERIAPYVLRLSASDYLELPELIENDISVELPPGARRVYDQLEKEFLAVLDSGETLTAPSTAVALGRCAQLANGAVYKRPVISDEGLALDKREWEEVHTAKLDALEDLVEELQGSPLLVAYRFQHDLFRLRARLGKDVPYIGSGVSGAQTADIVQRWNAGEIPVLLGHPQSMGHGLNMQGAGSHVCWYALGYDYELYDQFNRRVLRQGNTHKAVTVHRLVATRTVDEAMVAALRRKGQKQSALLDALNTYRK